MSEFLWIKSYPIPIWNTSTLVSLMVDDLIAVVEYSNELIKPKQCLGENPIVCYPPPVQHRPHDSCTHQITLTGAHNHILQTCAISLHNSSHGLLFSEQLNHVILVTWGELLIECCHGQVNQQILNAGTFKITWDGQCTITRDAWSMNGIWIQTSSQSGSMESF